MIVPMRQRTRRGAEGSPRPRSATAQRMSPKHGETDRRQGTASTAKTRQEQSRCSTSAHRSEADIKHPTQSA
jgi:hypothetical protein